MSKKVINSHNTTNPLLYRYGDRCPQSIPARIFAMAWFLVGLTVFAICMGSLTAFLTVTVVKMNSNRGTYNMAKDGQAIKVFFIVLIN